MPSRSVVRDIFEKLLLCSCWLHIIFLFPTQSYHCISSFISINILFWSYIVKAESHDPYISETILDREDEWDILLLHHRNVRPCASFPFKFGPRPDIYVARVTWYVTWYVPRVTWWAQCSFVRHPLISILLYFLFIFVRTVNIYEDMMHYWNIAIHQAGVVQVLFERKSAEM